MDAVDKFGGDTFGTGHITLASYWLTPFVVFIDCVLISQSPDSSLEMGGVICDLLLEPLI